jgi:hypothetical protein
VLYAARVWLPCAGLLMYGVCSVLCNVAMRYESGRGMGQSEEPYSVKEASGLALGPGARAWHGPRRRRKGEGERKKGKANSGRESRHMFPETGAPASCFLLNK